MRRTGYMLFFLTPILTRKTRGLWNHFTESTSGEWNTDKIFKVSWFFAFFSGLPHWNKLICKWFGFEKIFFPYYRQSLQAINHTEMNLNVDVELKEREREIETDFQL